VCVDGGLRSSGDCCGYLPSYGEDRADAHRPVPGCIRIYHHCTVYHSKIRRVAHARANVLEAEIFALDTTPLHDQDRLHNSRLDVMGNQNGKVAAAPVDMSIIETSLRASITAAIETKFTTITASLDLLTDQINELAATSKANTGALTVSIDNLRTSIPTHPTLTSSNLKHHTKSFQEDISPLDISAPPLHKAGSSNISDPEWDAATSPRDDDSGDAIADADALADITLSFNAQTASYICKSLNAVAGEIPVVGAIVELMGTVFEKIDEAQSNKEACENLGVRIFELGIALTSLLKKGHSHDNDVAMAGPLRTLHNQLVETAEFIATFSNRGWLQKMFWAKVSEARASEAAPERAKQREVKKANRVCWLRCTTGPTKLRGEDRSPLYSRPRRFSVNHSSPPFRVGNKSFHSPPTCMPCPLCSYMRVAHTCVWRSMTLTNSTTLTRSLRRPSLMRTFK